MIPFGPFDAPAGVMQLSENHTFSNAAALSRVVCRPVLSSAEQDIPPAPTTYSGQKLSPGRAESQPYIPLGTGAHQGGRGSSIGKSDDALQRMERIASYCFLVPVCHDIFSIQRQINVFRGNKEGIQKSLQRASSFPALRYSTTGRRRGKDGKQISFNEQDRHILPGLTCGVYPRA